MNAERLMKCVGIILNQPTADSVRIMPICGLAPGCFLLLPGHKARCISLVRDKSPDEVSVFSVDPDFETGQSMPIHRWIDPDGTDPSLFHQDLSGGLICNLTPSCLAVEYTCRLHLLSPSVFAFEISPQRESEYRQRAEAADSLKSLQEEMLLLQVPYPIELCHSEQTINYQGPLWATPGLLFGVMVLNSLNQEGVGLGTLRFVAEDPFDMSVKHFRLFRFGRPVGEAHVLPIAEAEQSLHEPVMVKNRPGQNPDQ